MRGAKTISVDAQKHVAYLFQPEYGPPPAGTPDIFLISLDTTRADHLSLYGYERPTSPNLEALAGDALVFHTFLLHRSQPNRSAATRWTMGNAA